MDSVILAAPLLPDKAEAWRRFCQALQGRRRQQYERSRSRLKIRREAIWLVPTAHGEMAVVAIAAPDMEVTLAKLATSPRPFDRWFRRNVLEVYGLDLSQPLDDRPEDPIFQWTRPEWTCPEE